MKRILFPLAVAASLLGESSAQACDCPRSKGVTASSAFRSTDIYVKGRIEAVLTPRNASQSLDYAKVKVRVDQAYKGARLGDVLDVKYDITTCGHDDHPKIGETLHLNGVFEPDGVGEASCFQYGDRDEYLRLMHAYPMVRDERFAKARKEGAPDGWLEAARLFMADGDYVSAWEAMAKVPNSANSISVGLLRSRIALRLARPKEAVAAISSFRSGEARVELMAATALRRLPGAVKSPERWDKPHEVDAGQWRASGADFTETEIGRMSIRNLRAPASNWQSLDVEPDFVESDLSGANLAGTRFARITMKDVSLAGANAKGASFGGSSLENVRAEGLRAEDSRFEYAKLRASDLANSDLRGASFAHAVLTGSRFAGANLRDADFSFADLQGVDLRGARLEGASLYAARVNCETRLPQGIPTRDLIPIGGSCGGMFDLDFRRRDMKVRPPTEGALATADNLAASKAWEGADLSGAILAGVDIGGLSFTGARLNGTDLRGARLGKTGASFAKTQLAGADLSDIEGTIDLADADLSRATVSGRVAPNTKEGRWNAEIGKAFYPPASGNGILKIELRGQPKMDGTVVRGALVLLRADKPEEMLSLVGSMQTARLADVAITCSGGFRQRYQVIQGAAGMTTHRPLPPAVDPGLVRMFEDLAKNGERVVIDPTCTSAS